MSDIGFEEFCMMIDDYIARGQLQFSRDDILHDMANNFLVVNPDGFIIYGFNRKECWVHHVYSRIGHDIKTALYDDVIKHAKHLGCTDIYVITPHKDYALRKFKGFKDTGQVVIKMEVS